MSLGVFGPCDEGAGGGGGGGGGGGAPGSSSFGVFPPPLGVPIFTLFFSAGIKSVAITNEVTAGLRFSQAAKGLAGAGVEEPSSQTEAEASAAEVAQSDSLEGGDGVFAYDALVVSEATA